MAAINPVSADLLKIDGEGPSEPDDQYLASKSHQFDKWDYDFNFNPSSLGEGHHISQSYSTRKQDDSSKNVNAMPANSNVDYDVSLFDSKDALTGIGTDQEVVN